MNKRAFFLFVTLCVSLYGTTQNEIKKYIPSEENLAARKWFETARFGLFIHWGVYSVLGDGEWVMNNQNISINEYEKLPKFFNPTKYDAEKWVLMAKNAGMKYITITSRHHDGFSMFDSKASDYNIIKKKSINIGMATALSDGNLIVPVIKNADQFSLLGLVKKVNDLAKRARNGNLEPDEVKDGTYTISNVGVFDTLMGLSLIHI